MRFGITSGMATHNPKCRCGKTHSLRSTAPPPPDAPYAKLNAKDPGDWPPSRVFNMECQFVGERVRYDKRWDIACIEPKGQAKAKDCPTSTPKCEQVNVVPVRGTRCVDELVKDKTSYYYVAIAITSTGTSTTSEEAIAEVPQRPNETRLPPTPLSIQLAACLFQQSNHQLSDRLSAHGHSLPTRRPNRLIVQVLEIGVCWYSL